MTIIEELNNWLKKPEGINLEFKEAKHSFSEGSLSDYCAALSNENGGKLILGVSNKKQIVGTKVFEGNENRLSNKLLDDLKIRVDVEEVLLPEGRVLIFHIPGHSPGQPVRSKGAYHFPMRAG
ncbi:MAG: transcriptional regulator [Candidatus Saganbacteria bacterium]|uniref:Transcriptional regulator n=1 Tax=Candidatus Saganbacteria bacterium TaxID=2575572 RepID=A0A833L0K9_UNCSA|nr:MAG: transcriptional regulator [Candidatus Saganbacteria bacterium]